MKTILVLLAVLLILPGCATNTGDAARDQRGRVANVLMEKAAKILGNVAVNSLQNAIQNTGENNINWQASASEGLWRGFTSVASGKDVMDVINAFSGPAAPALIKAARPDLSGATPAQAQAIAVVIADTIDKKTKL